MSVRLKNSLLFEDNTATLIAFATNPSPFCMLDTFKDPSFNANLGGP